MFKKIANILIGVILMEIMMTLYLPIEGDLEAGEPITIPPTPVEMTGSEPLSLATAAFFVSTKSMESSDTTVKFANCLRVYDRLREIFLDNTLPLKEQGVKQGSLLVVTAYPEKEELNKLFMVNMLN
jgi:hypothetical protein